MNDWIPICRVEDIPLLGSRRVTRPQGVDVALFRNDSNDVFALLDRCPHKGGPLSQGIVFGNSVACPLHNWAIGLEDGQVCAPDEGCTPRFDVRVTDGLVHLDAHQLATHAVELERPVAGPRSRCPVSEPASVTPLVTGHAQPGVAATDWPLLAATAHAARLTLAICLGMFSAGDIQDCLLCALPPHTPVVVIRDASLPSLRQTIADHRLASPSVIVVGDVVQGLAAAGATANEPAFAAAQRMA